MPNDQRSNLFARYDPLVKAQNLFKLTDDEGVFAELTIRPVWVIGDLMVLYDWLNSPLLKMNWNLNLGKLAVMQHYKQVLLSNYSQSFMLEQSNKQAMQIDVLPGYLSSYPTQIDFQKTDYTINFLFKESFRDTGIFKRSLQCVTTYLFSFTETHDLYLRLPKTEPFIQEQLTQIGFELIDRNNFFGKSLNIYRLRRIDYTF